MLQLHACSVRQSSAMQADNMRTWSRLYFLHGVTMTEVSIVCKFR